MKVKLNDELLTKEIERVLLDFKLPINKKTTIFIKEFINNQGGYEKFKTKTLKKIKKRAPLAPNTNNRKYNYKIILAIINFKYTYRNG